MYGSVKYEPRMSPFAWNNQVRPYLILVGTWEVIEETVDRARKTLAKRRKLETKLSRAAGQDKTTSNGSEKLEKPVEAYKQRGNQRT